MDGTEVNTNEENYRKEWATLTGRAPSDIYIPKALRETSNDDSPANGQAPTEDRGQ